MFEHRVAFGGTIGSPGRSSKINILYTTSSSACVHLSGVLKKSIRSLTLQGDRK
jgi:hypothetical protein